jgi:hypothetical protein
MGVEGQREELAGIAHTLVQAGAEVGVIANAEEFGVQETEVVYFRRNQQQQAQRLLDALGVGTLRLDTAQGDNFDVVVVLGQDYVDSLGGTTATTVPGVGTVPTGGLPSNGIPGAVTPGEPGGETTG